MVRCSKPREITISVSPKRGRIRPTSRRLTWCATNSEPPSAARSAFPKLYNGKNKSFFFFAYERFSLRQAANELVTVPTVAMRNGDFSGLVNSAGILQQLYDPNTTQARHNYSARRSRTTRSRSTAISPLAKTLYAATPLPQTADNPLVNSNFNAVNNTTQTVPNVTIRLDHVFNENNRLYFRFTDIDQAQQALRNYPANSPANIAGGGLPAGATGYQAIPDPDHQRSLGLLARVFPDLLLRDHPEPAMAADVCSGK